MRGLCKNFANIQTNISHACWMNETRCRTCCYSFVGVVCLAHTSGFCRAYKRVNGDRVAIFWKSRIIFVHAQFSRHVCIFVHHRLRGYTRCLFMIKRFEYRITYARRKLSLIFFFWQKLYFFFEHKYFEEYTRIFVYKNRQIYLETAPKRTYAPLSKLNNILRVRGG